jgi:hypothetical protein
MERMKAMQGSNWLPSLAQPSSAPTSISCPSLVKTMPPIFLDVAVAAVDLQNAIRNSAERLGRKVLATSGFLGHWQSVVLHTRDFFDHRARGESFGFAIGDNIFTKELDLNLLKALAVAVIGSLALNPLLLLPLRPLVIDPALPLEILNNSAVSVFTLLGVVGATVVYAVMRRLLPQPNRAFVILSVIVLLVSFVPDFLIIGQRTGKFAGANLGSALLLALLHITTSLQRLPPCRHSPCCGVSDNGGYGCLERVRPKLLRVEGQQYFAEPVASAITTISAGTSARVSVRSVSRTAVLATNTYLRPARHSKTEPPIYIYGAARSGALLPRPIMNAGMIARKNTMATTKKPS